LFFFLFLKNSFQLVGALKFVQGRLTQKQFFALFAGVILFTFSIGILILMLLTYAGYFKIF